MMQNQTPNYITSDIVGIVYIPGSDTEADSSQITQGVKEIFEAEPEDDPTEEST